MDRVDHNPYPKSLESVGNVWLVSFKLRGLPKTEWLCEDEAENCLINPLFYRQNKSIIII